VRVGGASTGSTGPQAEAELERWQTELARLADQVRAWQPEASRHLTVGGVFSSYQSRRSGVGTAGDPAWVAAVAIQDTVFVDSATITSQVGAPCDPACWRFVRGPLLEGMMQRNGCAAGHPSRQRHGKRPP
jgi:deoxyribonuclease V